MATLQVREAAHAQVSAAIRRGDLRRPAVCEECNLASAKTLHGHHEDYSRPLDVAWLCSGCHRRRHARKGELVSLTVSLPKWLDRAVESEKVRRDVTKQSLIEEALRLYLKLGAA